MLLFLALLEDDLILVGKPELTLRNIFIIFTGLHVLLKIIDLRGALRLLFILFLKFILTRHIVRVLLPQLIDLYRHNRYEHDNDNADTHSTRTTASSSFLLQSPSPDSCEFSLALL